MEWLFLACLGCRAVWKCSGGDVLSDLLAAERSSHKVDYKGSSFPFVELHLEQFISSSKGSGLGRTLETHWTPVGFVRLLAKACVVNCRCLRQPSTMEIN